MPESMPIFLCCICCTISIQGDSGSTADCWVPKKIKKIFHRISQVVLKIIIIFVIICVIISIIIILHIIGIILIIFIIIIIDCIITSLHHLFFVLIIMIIHNFKILMMAHTRRTCTIRGIRHATCPAWITNLYATIKSTTLKTRVPVSFAGTNRRRFSATNRENSRLNSTNFRLEMTEWSACVGAIDRPQKCNSYGSSHEQRRSEIQAVATSAHAISIELDSCKLKWPAERSLPQIATRLTELEPIRSPYAAAFSRYCDSVFPYIFGFVPRASVPGTRMWDSHLYR